MDTGGVGTFENMLAGMFVGYVDEVADAVGAAGYRVTERYVENGDHVVRVTLPGGTVADLVWTQLDWRLIVYPYGGPNPHDDGLSRVLSDDADARPRTLAQLARPVLDEAQRRWSK